MYFCFLTLLRVQRTNHTHIHGIAVIIRIIYFAGFYWWWHKVMAYKYSAKLNKYYFLLFWDRFSLIIKKKVNIH